MIYPQNFEQKIGFDVVRQNIKNLCINDLSHELIDKLNFSNNFSAIKNRLDYCDEMLHILENNFNILPVGIIENFKLLFKKTEIDGTFLETSELFSLKKFIENLNLLVDFFKKKDQNKFPLLTNDVKNIELFPNILKEISKILDKNGDIKDTATPELAKIRNLKAQTQSSVSKTLYRILQKAQNDNLVEKDAAIVIREGRLVIPVLSMNKKKIEGIIHDESATGKTFYVEPSQVVFLNNKLRELESDEKKEIVKILTAFTSFVRPSYAAIINSQNFYLQIDVLNAIAKYAVKIKAICPPINEIPIIDWQKARHPILQELLEKQGNTIVPLDIALNEKNRILVISGANAGGKSVCIKTAGLLQYMLQCGLPIPVGNDSQTGIFEAIFLDIGDGQNIENDLSTYSAHLQNLKFFTKNITDKTLVIIDEFGTGTEPEMGGAIAQAVLENFCKKQVFALITTHYTNLKYFAQQTGGIINGAMLYDRNKLKPLFVLKTGQTGSSFALEIAQSIGLPNEIIETAKNLIGSKQINYERLTQSAVKNKIYWENKREKIRLQSKKQDAIIAEYQAKLDEIEKQKKEIFAQAKHEAKTLIDNANAMIENTIRKIRESGADKEKTNEARQEIKTFYKKNIGTTLEVIQNNTDKQFKINDLVIIKGQNVVGQIIGLNDKKAVVIFGTIKTSVKLENLEYVSDNQTKKTTKANISKNTINEIRQKQLVFSREIDVRGMRVNEALQAVMHYIDDAQMLNISRLRILHGTGEGALRQAIREYLAILPFIKSFQDEHIQLGGAGITVVNF